MKYITTFLIVLCVLSVNAQEPDKITKKEAKAKILSEEKEIVKNHIENKSFVFDARTAFSATAGNFNVSYPYNVRLANDSVYSYLPYYGRAYKADYGSTESPMVFNLPVKEIEISKTRKKGYQVDVKVEKGMDNILFSFNISETGSATLTVNSSDRQAITYYGEILVKEKDNDNDDDDNNL